MKNFLLAIILCILPVACHSDPRPPVMHGASSISYVEYSALPKGVDAGDQTNLSPEDLRSRFGAPVQERTDGADRILSYPSVSERGEARTAYFVFNQEGQLRYKALW